MMSLDWYWNFGAAVSFDSNATVWVFCDDSLDAAQAAIASFISFAFTSYSACSFSRFLVFCSISLSNLEIFLLKSEISLLSSAISASNCLISAFKSAIFASDFSMAYNFSSACSLQKQAYLSYAAASFAPSAATFAERSFNKPITFSIGVTFALWATTSKHISAHKHGRIEIAMVFVLQLTSSSICGFVAPKI